MAKPMWFAGVCDQILARIKVWYENYERGEIYATRPFLGHDFSHKDVPVLYAHDVPWRVEELDHLVRILTAVKKDWTVTKDFTTIAGIVKNRGEWKKYDKLMKMQPGGIFILTLVFEKPDLKELFLVLKEVKDGKRDTLDELLTEQQQAGKDIWET